MQLIPDPSLAVVMTEHELVRAVLPNLERSWMGTKTFRSPAGTERHPVFRGLYSDSVDGTYNGPLRGKDTRDLRLTHNAMFAVPAENASTPPQLA